MRSQAGFTLAEMVISLGILAIIFGGTIAAYSSIIDTISNSALRTAATNAIENQIEMMRNLPYASVGTVGGIPAGVVPQTQTVNSDGATLQLNTYVRNIDDPFDGTLGGTPNDTSPADYKLVEITASCPLCVHFVPLTMTTTIAPKNLETASNEGSLFINVFNSNGLALSGVNVNVVNNNVSPPINLTDTTNNSGQLQLVGVPTSTQSYHIVVTKHGYSYDQTYPIGGQGNPNPVKPDVTVASNTLTIASFAIDKVSILNVSSTDIFCNAVADQQFSLNGSKIIGTNPDILKFSTSVMTDANGSYVFNNLEWDTYNFSLISASSDLAGESVLSPMTINPNTTTNLQLTVVPTNPNSLLVAVLDASTSAFINNASVDLSAGSYNQTLTTGHNYLSQSDWSNGQFTGQSGQINTNTPDQLTLLANASSSYPTSTQWLISQTMDFGSASTTFYGINFLPTSEPPQVGANSVEFQVAANNDNVNWNFTGPGGSQATYYTSSQNNFNGLYNGNRYLRYRIFLTTQNPGFTPTVNKVSIEFNGPCVPAGEALFQGLGIGAYNFNVSALGYANATGTAVVGSGESSTTIIMIGQ